MWKPALTLVIFLLTLIAAVFASYWVASILGFHSYLHGMDETDAEIIRRYHPVRLIKPEWVSSKPWLLFNWTLREAQARASLAVLLWLVWAVIGFRFNRSWKLKNFTRT